MLPKFKVNFNQLYFSNTKFWFKTFGIDVDCVGLYSNTWKRGGWRGGDYMCMSNKQWYSFLRK